MRATLTKFAAGVAATLLLPAARVAATRYRVNRGLRVVLLVPLAALLLGAGSATVGSTASASVFTPAAFPAYTYTPLLDSRSVFPAPGYQNAEVLMTSAFTMQPGAMRRVTDQLDVRMPGGHDYPEVGNTIICFDQHGHEIGQGGSGTNYTANGHAYQWNASILITAPAQNPAENYFCQIWTYVTSGNDTSYRMTVLAPTPGQTTYGTWLEVSSSDEVGAQMWLYGGNCPTKDTMDQCEYIGGGSRPHAIDFLAGWTAASDATAIDALATFQITSCPSGTKSCGPGEHGSDRNANGVTWLNIDQLYPDGSVCQAYQAYSEETTGGQVLLTKRFDISDAQHHRPLFYHVSAPVSPLCRGSHTFSADLHIQWTSQNPVKIDGGNVNVIQSVPATTKVPVVPGRTQA